jgi:hypothetical protein
LIHENISDSGKNNAENLNFIVSFFRTFTTSAISGGAITAFLFEKYTVYPIYKFHGSVIEDKMKDLFSPNPIIQKLDFGISDTCFFISVLNG